MELKIRNGDYVSDGVGGVQRVNGGEELLERVIYRLSVPRGSFAPDETLGSGLHLLWKEKKGDILGAAKKYVAEALTDEDLTVTEVSLEQQGDLLAVTVSLCYEGEDAAVKITVGGN